MMYSPQEARRLFAWRLYTCSRRTSFQVRHCALERALSKRDQSEWLTILAAILLIEMHERGSLWRAFEWTASWVGQKLGSSRSITRGPLQLRNAPWDFDEAIASAVNLLILGGCSSDISAANLRLVAETWNGRIGSSDLAFNYDDALESSLRALRARRLLT